MSLKKVTRLDEGPLDFLRGAGGEAGRKIKNSGLGRAVGDVVRAGREASAAADARALQGQLGKAVQKLGELVARYNELNGEPDDENPQGEQRVNPAAPDNGQRPAQQQTDNVKQKSPVSTGIRGVATPPAGAPTRAGLVGRPPRSRMTFDSFMQQTFAGQEQLDEGIWDFLKGATGAGVNKLIQHYQNKPSVLKDLYHAGKQASAEGDIRSLEKKIQAQAAAVQALAAKMGPQGQAAIQAAIQALPQPQQRATSYFIRKTTPTEPTM